MPRQNAPFLSFNHGLVSKLALARVDTSRLKFAAETMANWLPRTVGPMMLRPGLGFIGNTKVNSTAKLLPFVRSVDDTALIEVTGAAIRFWVDDALVTRPSVSTTIANPEFTVGSGWALDNVAGATSSQNSGALSLFALPYSSKASAKQTVSVASGDRTKRHGLRINVLRGPIEFQVGTGDELDDLIHKTTLGRGVHSLAFTPGSGVSNVYLKFESSYPWQVLVDSCDIEAAGTLELPPPWGSNYPKLRINQSGDVVYVACDGYQQRKIERRAADSWSIVLYQPPDGPFQPAASANIGITPSAARGTIFLTADAPFFRADHAGTPIRLTIKNQIAQGDISDDDTFSDTIRIHGVAKVRQDSTVHTESNDPGTISNSSSQTAEVVVGGTRTFAVAITGTWSGTLTLQRSVDGPDAGFDDVQTYTANVSTGYSDTLDNVIAWYRIGFKAGDLGSGTANVTLYYKGGGKAGVVRIESVSSPTVAIGSVLTPLSSYEQTRDWQESAWSDRLGWPSAVALYLGRLYWAGLDKIWGSVSDAYESFDDETKGDAGPIARSIGYGPVQVINWLLALGRLVLGTGGAEVSVRTSTTDEPITPTNFGLRDVSTQGSAPIPGVKIDTRGLFVQRSKRRIYQLVFDPNAFDYVATDLTALLPDLPSDFVDADVGRQPDTRAYFVCADGTVLVNLFEPAEEVQCFYRLASPGASGFIESVCVLPGPVEDQVYFIVRRTINGSLVRQIEKLARLDQAVGGSTSCIADSYVYYSGAAVTTITGLDHLEGEEVVVWGNGKDLGTKTVASGQITGLSEAVTTACVGLAYDADFKSAKLSYAAAEGTPLTQKKRISHLGLVLKDTHVDGLRYGPSFDTLDPLPLDYREQDVGADVIYDMFDEQAIEFPGEWDTDARLCLRASAPRPCTVLGAVVTVATNDKPAIGKAA